MDDFTSKFELRRIIFGLSAIIATPVGDLPAEVNESLPQIMNELTKLTSRIHHIRLDILHGAEDLDQDHWLNEDFDNNEEDIELNNSRTDATDEIKTLKATLTTILDNNAPLHARLMSGIPTLGERSNFEEIMKGI